MPREVTTVSSPTYRGYLVSSDGAITGPRGAVLKTRNFGAGYRAVIVYLPGHVRRMVRVHRMVAEAFHGPAPTPRHEVAHWDGDPANNRATNLRWVTSKENKADRARHGRTFRPAGELNAQSRLTVSMVLEARALTGQETLTSLARRYGVSRRAMSDAVAGRSWSHVPFRAPGQASDEDGCSAK